MYSRVATTEWNIEKPTEKIGKVASHLLKQTVENYDDDQIKAAIGDLESNGSIETMLPEDIADYVKRKKVTPKLKQFQSRASLVMADMRMIEPIKIAAANAFQRDEELKGRIASIITANPDATVDSKVEEVLRLVVGKIHESVSDTSFVDKNEYYSKVVSDLIYDNMLKSFIK